MNNTPKRNDTVGNIGPSSYDDGLGPSQNKRRLNFYKSIFKEIDIRINMNIYLEKIILSNK